MEIKLRPQQEYVLSRIEQNDKKLIIVNAPTGVGKSIINLLSANEIFGTAYITTPLRILVDQYRNDIENKFAENNLGKTIMGRQSYDCAYNIQEELRYGKIVPQRMKFLKADSGPCIEKNPTYFWEGHKVKICPYRERGKCDYYNARDAAMISDVTLTTFDYFMKGIYPKIEQPIELSEGTTWNKRVGLIIDEAHNLPNKMTDMFTIEITRRTYPALQDDKQARDNFDEIKHRIDSGESVRDAITTFHLSYITQLQSIIDQINEKEELTDIEKNDKQRLLKLQYRLNNLIDNINGENMILSMDDKHIQFRPFSPAPYLKDFWKDFDRILLTSATFFGLDQYMEDLGLDMPYEYIEVPSTFPPEKGMIEFPLNVRLSRDNFQDTLPEIVYAVDTILEKHPDERGLIHAHTYAYAKAIMEKTTQPDRIITHDSLTRSDALKEFLHSDRKDIVLLSVNMGEGLDLKDDLARFQIIVKCPYGNLGDPWTREHFNHSKKWYDYEAIKVILQASGRIVRSEEDYGTTYILDMRVYDLIKKYYDSMPLWFRERIEAKEKVDMKKIQDELGLNF